MNNNPPSEDGGNNTWQGGAILAKSKKFPVPFQVYISKEMDQLLSSVADARGIPKSVLVREILRDYLKLKGAENSQDIIQKFVSEAVREQLKPVEERLAKINAKTAYAAAISLYVCIQAIFDLGKRDVAEAFRNARKKAVELVKERIPHTGDLEKWVLEAEKSVEKSVRKENE
jgi:predicted transcriptional regulator